MLKVKTFTAGGDGCGGQSYHVDVQMSEFLEKHPGIEVKAIEYTSCAYSPESSLSAKVFFSALLMYEDKS